MNSQRADDILAGVVDIFSEKKFPKTCAKTFINSPKTPSSQWSLGNQILMLSSGTEDARGYKQWGKVHRNVKKGSKAFYILIPMTKNIKDKKSDEDRVITVGFRGIPVFRYEDTEGQPLEKYEPKELPPLFDLAKKKGIDVKYGNSRFGEYGSIDLAHGNITLSTESADTFLHELVHWYDNKNQKLKSGQDPVQETVAQLGACVLAAMYGYDAKEYTWRYIATYTETDSPKKVGQACMKVLSRVQKIINEILADAEALGVPVEVKN